MIAKSVTPEDFAALWVAWMNEKTAASFRLASSPSIPDLHWYGHQAPGQGSGHIGFFGYGTLG